MAEIRNMRTIMIITVSLSILFAWLLPSKPSFAQDGLCYTHQNSPKGPHLSCNYCHDDPYPGYLKDNKNLSDTTICNDCHSQSGQFDGVNDSTIGGKANWKSGGVYAGESLKPGKEKWCISCHDEGRSIIQNVSAPNIAGLSMSENWQSPSSIFFTQVPEADNLLDHALNSGIGSCRENNAEIVFDLGSSMNISHIRLFTALNSDTHWRVEGKNEGGNWTRILYGQSVLFASPTWRVGPQNGWNEIRVDSFIPIRYLKIIKINPWPLAENSLCEFEFKRNLQYGYYVNGHKMSCIKYCHDAQKSHIDGKTRTYHNLSNPYNIQDPNNYQNGYRLKMVEISGNTYPPLEIPRTGLNSGEYPRTSFDFVLCFKCHDKYKLLGDAYGSDDFNKYPLQTNFCYNFHPDDPAQLIPHLDPNGKVVNQHLLHLRGRFYGGNGKDWDSDWDMSPDSPQSCPACHNVHGSPLPAMVRHGELAGTPGTVDKPPMFNLQYVIDFVNGGPKTDRDLLDVMGSIGGLTQFYGPGPGAPKKNKVCNTCHNDHVIYYRTPVPTCQGCHAEYVETHASHSAHLILDRGPAISCWDCHAGSPDNPHEFIFADGKILAETKVCDGCHSPDGAFDGVNDPEIGAKSNWPDGVYQDHQLKEGKEKWCIGCHDNGTSISKGVNASNIAGNGTTFGYYSNGHVNVLCSECHDLKVKHIDGAQRTYAFSIDQYKTNKSGISYAAGYRLRYINGQVPMMIPATYSLTFGSNKDNVRNNAFRLCFGCHNSSFIFDQTTNNGITTNFSVGKPQPPRNYSFAFNINYTLNEHYKHLLDNMILTWPYADSDWDINTTGHGPGSGIDSLITCITCHNVHGAQGINGSTNEAMIRDGSLVGRSGFGFSYVIKNDSYPRVTSQGATQQNSVGAVFRNITGNNMCFLKCHGGATSQPNTNYNADNSRGSYLEYYRRYQTILLPQ